MLFVVMMTTRSVAQIVHADGAIEHEDSLGNRGRIGAGDVQWMTAGVIHSVMPAEEIRRNGGRLHGFQLWVNLPRRDKMMKPRYQELRAAEIPTATSADGKATVTVIAGESLGTRATIDTSTPIMYLHIGDRPARENDAVTVNAADSGLTANRREIARTPLDSQLAELALRRAMLSPGSSVPMTSTQHCSFI